MFRGVQKFDRIHNIGSQEWYEQQNRSVDWYMTTNFDEFFTEEVEVIQAHSYDFTYALLRNKHFQHKTANFGLHKMHCMVCCIWHYLFKVSPSFNRIMTNFITSKLKLSKSTDLMFINLNLMSDNFPTKFVLQHAEKTMKCAQKVSTILRNPVWVLASNSLMVLEEVPKVYTSIKPFSVFYNREHYMVDLQRLNASNSHHLKVPRTEQNALFRFFLGFYLQLNSTVLFIDPQSHYSEVVSAFREFQHPGGKIVYPERSCQLQRFKMLG